MILVEGRIAVDKYQDNEGNDKIFTKIIVSEVVALDKKSENSGETKKVDVSLKGTFYQNQNVEQPEIIYESEEISGDELPF
jgi:single-stranded DNA-binding protein